MWKICWCYAQEIHNLLLWEKKKKVSLYHYFLLQFWINVAAKYKLNQAYQEGYGRF